MMWKAIDGWHCADSTPATNTAEQLGQIVFPAFVVLFPV